MVKNLRLNKEVLKIDKEMQELYRVTVKNRYNAIAKIQSIDEQWEMLRDSIHQTSKEVLPERGKIAKKKWMNEDILNLMDKRKQYKNDKQEYAKINKEIKDKCGKAKESWLNEKCKKN